MRLYSTPQSALAGEVTVLAIIETIAATAFSIWLVVHRGTLTHVVIGACAAPFLLLRTDDATTLAITWFNHLDALLDKMSDFQDESQRAHKRLRLSLVIALSVLLILIVYLAMFLSRPLSVILVALRSPIDAIRAIPQNWNRMVLATDLFHLPEIIPGAETTSELPLDIFIRFSTVWTTTREELFEGKLLMGVFGIFFVLIFYVPALAYRYALKATAIIYLPILWTLHDSSVGSANFRYKLEDIKESQIERLKRWYSGFVLLFLVIIPFIIYLTKQEWWQEITTWMQSAHPAVIALLSAFLPTAPSGLEIHGWHLARGINATLTIALFVWTDGKLRQMARGTFQKTGAAVASLNLWLLVRGILTLYIIGCTIYIVAAAVNWRGLWPVHVRWFPWR